MASQRRAHQGPKTPVLLKTPETPVPPILDPADVLDLLTPKQVAAILHMVPRSLEALRQGGEGPPYIKTTAGRSGRVLYPRQALQAWIQDRLRRSTTEG